MFDFGNANDNQRIAISTTEGPVLITAGPGTGKTYTLVQRAIYLIEEKGVAPEEIMIATFTEKAAKELITRITNELESRNIIVNVNEIYVGTFHSLCLRILKEHLEYSRLKKNYRVLDQFDQNYEVFRHINLFRHMANFGDAITSNGAWNQANDICTLVNNLSEELVDASALKQDEDPAIRAMGEIMEVYKAILADENLLDFSTIQTEAYQMLIDNPSVLQELWAQLKYIMVDEYQDTNYIQEQIVFLIGNAHNNICVVGDDDQGLYRFRGATIRNILEFPEKFEPGECKIIPLDVNYRSNSDIVDFYNKWMVGTYGANFRFDWGKFRYPKTIIANNQTTLSSPAVIRISGEDDEAEWHQRLLEFIKKLRTSGKLTDYNQIAFLFSSVKNTKAVELAQFFEKNGINVYSPRSDMFFNRFEIRFALGVIMLLFPAYVNALEQDGFVFLKPEHAMYYKGCMQLVAENIQQTDNKDLLKWIRSRGLNHVKMTGTTDYAFSGLFYQMLEYEPFKSILDVDMTAGVVDVRPTRNLALLSQILGKYEYLNRIDVFNPKYINKNVENLFNLYLRLLYDGGIAEYEDDSEYAPSGCISFMTIHQSKGMEFPIVFVDSLGNGPRKSYKDIMETLSNKYFHRPPFEPYKDIKFFDFWRLYYTAYSRAQNLLVLTCNETKGTPSKYFEDTYADTIDGNNARFNLEEFDFATVKDVNLKESYAFTSHISVYETCAKQYLFYKELEFAPVRAAGMLFGQLVHQTIEDIHKAALRKEEKTITADNISKWFDSNYLTLSKTEHSYLAEPQKEVALKQVLRYAEKQQGKWGLIQQAEVDVSLVKQDYIIEGKIDLIKGENDTVEIVDFKSEKKPDMVLDSKRLEQYRRQLHVYAYLVEQRTGKKVSRMHLYYTGEENGNPLITYPYTSTAIDGTIASFEDTVRHIKNKDFKRCANDLKTCRECDFRYYCQDN